MLPTSAAVLLRPAAAAATALLLVVALQLPAAAADTAWPPGAPVGLSGCDTSCGNVRVPYPFGFGPSRCYRPGFNLTCDTRHNPPQLLLGDGTLRVTDISLRNGTVRVIRKGFIINTTDDFPSGGFNASFGLGFREHGYLLSGRNELVVSGCNVVATLLADVAGAKTPQTISGCATICPKVDDINGVGMYTGRSRGEESKRCSRASGDFNCCKKPLSLRSRPDEVQAKWLNSEVSHSMELVDAVSVFVAEEGWVDDNGLPYVHEFVEAPLLLEWEIAVGAMPQNDSCSKDVRHMLCKSEHTTCSAHIAGYVCSCEAGYDGNPYLEGGCQDIDECKLPDEMLTKCFGECFNTIGSYQCSCPPGTNGNPLVKGGCVHYNFTREPMVEQIGKPNCSTTCGSVHVPYPFGVSPECSGHMNA